MMLPRAKSHLGLHLNEETALQVRSNAGMDWHMLLSDAQLVFSTTGLFIFACEMLLGFKAVAVAVLPAYQTRPRTQIDHQT